MKKIIGLILLLGCASLCRADFLARAICLNTYTNSLTKCGPNPGLLNPIAYAKWSVCVNAAITAYYACIAKSYVPTFPFDYPGEEVEMDEAH